MDIKKWLEAVLMPSIFEIKTELTSFKTEFYAELVCVKKDISHLEKEMLLRFDQVDVRFSNVDSRFTALEARLPSEKLILLESRVTALESKMAAMER